MKLVRVAKTKLPRFMSARSVGRIFDRTEGWARALEKDGLLKGYRLPVGPNHRELLLFLERDVKDFLAARGLPTDGD